VLSQVLNSNGDLYLAALYSTELATDPLSKALIEAKCRELTAGRKEGQQRFSGSKTWCWTEDRNPGGGKLWRTFGHRVAPPPGGGRSFPDWLQHQEPDVDIVASYYHRVTEGTWAETLPVKTLRWAVAVGVGFGVGGLGPEGIAVSASIGAADMFLSNALLAVGDRVSLSRAN
jgi:hypothetical protein